VEVCKDTNGLGVHLFHKKCMLDWVTRSNECPSCRRAPLVDMAMLNLA
jgi:hypothetical protein